ncbi:hypothetical protein BJY01DRAFT_256130 [Aspergillus pseudoustus]|uniref:Fatty acid hydroxylase domain-containing protein n=1 Tax=Aspergillus pseudoustus TaxID=1810923 RepID=A0ABR4IDT2_9EURO
MSARPNLQDSMKSTWRRQDKSQWTFWHKILDSIDAHHVELDKKVPVHQKDEKIPYIPDWNAHRWILIYTGIPLSLHELYVRWRGSNFGPIIAYFFYYNASRLTTIREIRSLRTLGHKYGFLDGDQHERDGVPDSAVQKTLTSVILAGTIRPLLMVYLAYTIARTPSAMNYFLLPLQIGIYGIVLDFWFYWYHRLMHEVDGLWKFHRRHHLTKHPTPLLAIYADHEQEFFDIAGIPLITFFSMKMLGFPMGFYEWYFCQQYVTFAEIAGHSGLRLHAAVPNPLTFLLRRFDAELVIEDHDLHHRRGWKGSYNYGKQTRLWDRIFGTSGTRIESVENMVDYGTSVSIPLY